MNIIKLGNKKFNLIMTREIKFRGKDEQGEWQEGHLLIQLGIHYILTPIWEMYHNEYVETDRSTKHRVNACTVGQFTGLLDKNGIEIYEGDIMGLPERDAKGVAYKNRYVRVVEWVNDGFFLLDCCTMGGEVRKYGDRLALEISLKSNYDGIARCFQRRGLDYTVIGNIHDNPELLKD